MSIYEHIRKNVRADRPGLSPEGLALPGAAADATFAPGAHDHRILYKGTKAEAKALAKTLDRIEAAARAAAEATAPDEKIVRALEEALDVPDAIALVDDLVDRIESLALEDYENLYDALSAVGLNTNKPQSLKLAMALLAPFVEPETVPFYGTLARHPEFSLYATTALANDASPAARAELVSLLDATTGWAKVDVVERLLRLEDLEIGEVLLTKAMDDVDPVGGMIALGVADRCDLAGAMDSKEITRDTLTGAVRILAQLAEDGTLDDYDDRDETLSAFCERLPGAPADLEWVEAAASIRRWAARKPRSRVAARPSKRAPPGTRIPKGSRKPPPALDLAEETTAYLERPDVIGVIVSGILSKETLPRDRAARLAAFATMADAFETLREAMEKYPDDDAVVAAAVALATGDELARLRDRLAGRIKPETRTGVPDAIHALDAGARHTWQYLTLLEALVRLPDATSRALLRTATRDRDPAVRRIAFRSLRTAAADADDRKALEAAATDPVPDIAAAAK